MKQKRRRRKRRNHQRGIAQRNDSAKKPAKDSYSCAARNPYSIKIANKFGIVSFTSSF